MSPRPAPLTEAELAQAFAGEMAERFPPVLSPTQFAQLLGGSVKTVYEWLSKGRLKNSSRKRGKHVFIFRDRALHELFSGPDWRP